ncbi:MAG: site-specific integrase, partial [Bacteroidetes bacterium]|nr:site-specific integrase [Bacteroidota bacterium]
MATINFYLWDADSEGRHPIFLVYQDRGSKFRHYIGEKVFLKEWDPKTQRVRRNVRGAVELNLLLQSFEDRIRQFVRLSRAEGRMPTVAEVSNIVRPEKVREADFDQYRSDFLSFKSTYAKHGSMQVYQAMFRHLDDYFRSVNIKPSIEKMNQEWLDGFRDFLYKDGLTDNTVHKQIGTFRTFVNWANKRGAGIQGDFSEVKVTKREAAKVYLTMEELKNLANCTPDSQRLEHVRDVFIFACVTGLRYSDLAQLAPEHIFTSISINGQPVREIRMNMVKTERVVTIPLNRMALEILDRYAGQFSSCLPVISNQKFNEYLKELCQFAGITHMVKRIRFRGKERLEESLPKSELVTVHTARHTFATLSLELGMRPEVVMKLLGHTSIKMTMQYVRILDEVKAKEMM